MPLLAVRLFDKCKFLWGQNVWAKCVWSDIRSVIMMDVVCYIHCVSKNAPHLVYYNFDIHEDILIFLENVTDKVSNQKTLYCATPNNLCFCTIWKTGKHENRIFSLKCCIRALPEFTSSLLDFLSLFDSRLIPNAATWLPKSCNQCTQLGAVRGHGSGERKSRAPQQLDCVARTMHVH